MESRELGTFSGVTPAWRDMMRLQDEMSSLLSRLSPVQVSAFPAMNLWVDQESAFLSAELPGVKLDDLDISVEGDILSVQGRRTREELKESDKWHRRERVYGQFTRTLQLPFRVEPDDVSATFKNGVLQIELPRAQADRPKKISIRS